MQNDEGLKRVIGVRSLTANGINLTIGAGIFALPAVVAGYLGPASPLAYVVCTALLMLVLLCFIELGTKFSVSGGAYAYVELAFGPYAGFIINTLYAFGFAIMADAAVAHVLADNLSIFFPLLKTDFYRVIFLALVFIIIILLNVRGVKQGVILVEGSTIGKLIPLLILIVVGFFSLNIENLKWTEWPSLTTLGEVSLILFFAFGGGVETTLNGSGEIKNPKTTIPVSLLTAVFCIFLIYVSVQVVAQGVLGSELAEQKEAPLAKVAERTIGEAGVWLLVAGAAVSCFGLISGDILATSRLLFAAARDGLFPSFLGRIHPKYATPHWAIIVYAAIGFFLSMSGGFRQLAILSSSSLLLIYIGVILATIKLRKKKVEKSFSVPGGLLIPVLALLATLWFLSNLQKEEIIGVTMFVASMTILFFVIKVLKR